MKNAKEVQYLYRKKIQRLCSEEIMRYSMLQTALFKARVKKTGEAESLASQVEAARNMAMRKAIACLTWEEHKEIINSLDEGLAGLGGSSEIRSMPEFFKSCIV